MEKACPSGFIAAFLGTYLYFQLRSNPSSWVSERLHRRIPGDTLSISPHPYFAILFPSGFIAAFLGTAIMNSAANGVANLSFRAASSPHSWGLGKSPGQESNHRSVSERLHRRIPGDYAWQSLLA